MDVTRLLIPAQANGQREPSEPGHAPAVHLELILRDELVEPAASLLTVPEPLQERFAAASERLRVVVEFTERALTARPAE